MRITTNFMLLASVLTAGALATACSEEKLQETPDRDEIYAREFIKEFGAPDPDHDWTMATTAGLRVNAPDPVSLQVYAEIDGKLYIFADIPGYKGENAVPVTIPKGTEELIVVADDTEYRCSPSATLDLTTAQPTHGSRATHITVRDPSTSKGDFNITVDNSETGYVTFNLDENPALKKILDDPYNSEYLKSGSDNGWWLGGPLIPNGSNYYAPHFSKGQSFDVYPIYINDGYGNTPYPNLTLSLCMTPDKNAKNYNGKVYTLASTRFGLYSSLNGTEWEENCMPDGPYVKSSRMSVDIEINDWNNELYMSYAIASQYSPRPSHTFSWFNYEPWGNNFYDAPIKDMNTCYCTTLFYNEVPVKWALDGGNTEKDLVSVYAMYHAPNSAAETRPNKPDVFFIEHHEYGIVEWDQEFEDAKEAKTYRWRLYAEDLGGSHDWDFNDLVVEFSDILTRYTPDPVIPDNFIPTDKKVNGHVLYKEIIDEERSDEWIIAPYSQLFPQFTDPKLDEDMMVREITVTPLAAGGTLPIYFAFHGKLSGKHPVDPDMLLSDYINNHQSPVYHEGDFVIGCEMHKWLGGSSHHTPLNVGETKTHSGKEVTFYTTADLSQPNSGSHGLNTQNMNNFRVLVDPDNTIEASLGDAIDGNTDIKSVDINAWNGGYIVNKPSLTDESRTPQIIISSNFCPWTKEGKNFGEAYPDFGDWIRNPNSAPLWTVRSRVYELLVKE